MAELSELGKQILGIAARDPDGTYMVDDVARELGHHDTAAIEEAVRALDRSGAFEHVNELPIAEAPKPIVQSFEGLTRKGRDLAQEAGLS